MEQSTQLVKKFPAFYRTQKFITAFAKAHPWSLPGARGIQSTTPRIISLTTALILYSHLRLSLPSGLFPLGFPTKILYAFLISSNHWRALVNAIMNLLVPQKAGSFMTSWMTISFSRRTSLYGVSALIFPCMLHVLPISVISVGLMLPFLETFLFYKYIKPTPAKNIHLYPLGSPISRLVWKWISNILSMEQLLYWACLD